MESKVTVNDLYNHIIKFYTPEEALKMLLASSILTYEKLKFPEGEAPVHPLIIITMVALDLGWAMTVERDSEIVDGMCVGSVEYLERVLK